ncbi:MAG: non-homologous end-joining DNA ligase LigD [Nitrososphaeria archaeon]
MDGSNVLLKERLALLLSIKEEGKVTEFGHLFEKVCRDVEFVGEKRIGEGEFISILNELQSSGFIEKVDGGYLARPEIESYVMSFVESLWNVLNRSYMLVFFSKRFYSRMGEYLLPFVSGRPVTVVKVFSGKSDPIHEIDPILVRYERRKPKPVHFRIDDMKKLMQLVFDHCIDFIPYIHREDGTAPDYVVVDLDAGEKVSSHPNFFEYLKCIASEAYDLLEENEVNPLLKFSGSRGFQIWFKPENDRVRAEDYFLLYRNMISKFQLLLEKRLQEKKRELVETFEEIVPRDGPITTAQTAKKEERMDKVLVDASIMKVNGDVRAPFSMHHKTGLIALPVKREKIIDFKREMAHPLKAIERQKEFEWVKDWKTSDPSALLEKLGL